MSIALALVAYALSLLAPAGSLPIGGMVGAEATVCASPLYTPEAGLMTSAQFTAALSVSNPVLGSLEPSSGCLSPYVGGVADALVGHGLNIPTLASLGSLLISAWSGVPLSVANAIKGAQDAGLGTAAMTAGSAAADWGSWGPVVRSLGSWTYQANSAVVDGGSLWSMVNQSDCPSGAWAGGANQSPYGLSASTSPTPCRLVWTSLAMAADSGELVEWKWHNYSSGSVHSMPLWAEICNVTSGAMSWFQVPSGGNGYYPASSGGCYEGGWVGGTDCLANSDCFTAQTVSTSSGTFAGAFINVFVGPQQDTYSAVKLGVDSVYLRSNTTPVQTWAAIAWHAAEAAANTQTDVIAPDNQAVIALVKTLGDLVGKLAIPGAVPTVTTVINTTEQIVTDYAAPTGQATESTLQAIATILTGIRTAVQQIPTLIQRVVEIPAQIPVELWAWLWLHLTGLVPVQYQGTTTIDLAPVTAKSFTTGGAGCGPFPFAIPCDLLHWLQILNVSETAPVFTFHMRAGLFGTYAFTINPGPLLDHTGVGSLTLRNLIKLGLLAVLNVALAVRIRDWMGSGW